MTTPEPPAGATGPTQIVAGRSCKDCTLCCKLMGVRELNKPRGTWCSHCAVTKGCKIHGSHPVTCRDFSCGYLLNPALDERWKPSKCKMVLVQGEMLGTRLAVHVDPGRPGAWREEPFYSQLKRWAIAAARTNGQVIVWVGAKMIFILPDRDRDLGEVGPDQVIVTLENKGPLGSTLDVSVMHRDDPRLKSVEPRTVIPNQDLG